MKKEKIFSKFNTRTFNNELEEVLALKPFSENVKNEILSMIYKIEEAYNDYELTKVEVLNEKKFLESILVTIRDYCNLIEISNSSQMKEKNVVINYEEGHIKVLSNHTLILLAILKMQNEKDNNYSNELNIIQNMVIYDLLKIGYYINNMEVIRDFNGWSWITSLDNNFKINLVYQNLQFLLDNYFIEDYMKKFFKKPDDCFKIIKNELQEKYNKDMSQEILDLVRKIAIIEIANANEEYKERILKIKEQKLEQYNLLENKKEYLKEITNIKKQKSEIIKNIDKLINNTELLKEEYKLRNSKLKNSEKIFSVSCLVDILNAERKEALDKITEINKLMDPKTYVKRKQEIENSINEISVDEKNSNEYILELQKIFIKVFQTKVEKEEEKQEIIKYLYKIRYYNNILFLKDKYVKDIIEIKEEIEKLNETIIYKLLKNKLVFEFSDIEEVNKKILINIIDTRIINLQKIYILLKKDKDKLKIEVYDEDELYKVEEIEFKDMDSKNLKLNKKIKIFI